MTELTVAFSHVHMYVDRVEEFEVYKELEIILNDHSMDHATVSIANDKNDESFLPQNRDIIRQLMAGLGFRVTAFRSFPTSSTNTKTMLVTSPDPNGVQFVVSSLDPQSNVPVDDFHHFDAVNIHRFFGSHNGRQGIAVLAFAVNNVDELYARYQEYHPKLLLNRSDYTTTTTLTLDYNSNGNDANGGPDVVKILETYAYYQGDATESGVDVGTVLRFVEQPTKVSSSIPLCPLPGLSRVSAVFETSNDQAAYCDHWVSNGAKLHVVN